MQHALNVSNTLTHCESVLEIIETSKWHFHIALDEEFTSDNAHTITAEMPCQILSFNFTISFTLFLRVTLDSQYYSLCRDLLYDVLPFKLSID